MQEADWEDKGRTPQHQQHQQHEEEPEGLAKVCVLQQVQILTWQKSRPQTLQ